MSTTTPEYTITVDHAGAAITWQGQTFTVEPEDLDAGGWEFQPTCDRDHCDEGDCPECTWCAGDPGSAPATVLDRWHADQGHPGPLRLCYEEPCKALGEALGVRGG